MSYDLKALKAPRLAGASLRAFVFLLEHEPSRSLLAPRLLKDAGVAGFRRAQVTEAPSVWPALPRHGSLEAGKRPAPDLARVAEEAPARSGFHFESIGEFARAYRDGRANPEEVAERVLEAQEAAERGERPLRALVAVRRDDVLEQARASRRRHERGEARGVLDGVPVAVKDELDQVPYPTMVGTRFLGRAPAHEDATVVARLRAAGALLIGKANMHEIGLGVTGLNPHHGTARNPYNPDHHTGGSSSGPAAAVAAGLCPLAIGADGGGSIRTPSSMCGLAGLKATYGRISEHGAYPLCWSVAHVGPIAATIRDAAIGYAVIAGECPHDPNTRGQPQPHLADLGQADLSGVRLGVFRPWFEDAEPDVVKACREAIAALEARGATLHEVSLPELELTRVAHLITIASEMCAAMEPLYGVHRVDHGLDVRVNLALARLFTSRDYVKAQRVRTRFLARCARLMKEVDVLVTPTNGATAPPIAPDALSGETDLTTTGAILRYVFPANLNGYPALSVPAGYAGNGLPVGLQLMGRPWEEHLLLRLGEVVEQAVERREPELHYRLLG